jgi:hypothetical protein
MAPNLARVRLVRVTRSGGLMNLQSRLESLKTRHGRIDGQITVEDQRPRPDTTLMSRLKLEKLRLKEEMDRLRSGLAQA